MNTPRIEDVFAEALEWPPEDRDHRLDEACCGDAKLRAEIESLLEAYTQAGPFMAEPSVEPSPSEPVGEGPGSTVGRYRLLQLIGEGGFGAVFMAEQREPVKRTVALKIIKLGMDTKQVIARFEAERQALAMMDHPSIAKVLDAGATEAGRPYFVMELVRGDSITQFCDRENLSIPQRLDLFQQVCHAVQHAHQKGIIHRDLKPSNILVSEIDGRPTPKIIDFGIAKATGGHAQLTDKTPFTDLRQFIGTPEYMSPEQAGMGSVDIDTRSDIYSLGVLLYELLTGGPPFDPKTLRLAAWEEMRRIIREDDPEHPSTRLSTRQDTPEVAAHRGAEPARLIGLVRGDLDWIVMKSLEKDRARRYETANALAMDVGRHLVGEPVVAAPPSRLYRMRKFASRNRGPVAAGLSLATVLVLGTIGTSAGLIWALRETDRANIAEDLAEQRADELEREIAFKESQFVELDTALRLVSGNRKDETEAALREALAERRKTLGDLDPYTLSLIEILGTVLMFMGRYDESEPYLHEALRGYREVFGDGDPKTIQCMARTGRLLRMLGRIDEAYRLCAEAVGHARIVLRNTTEEFEVIAMGAAMSQYANTLLAAERFEEAEAAYLEKYTLHESLGTVPFRTQISASHMVRIYKAWHKAEPDQGYDIKADEWRARVRALEAENKPPADSDS